MNRPEEVMRRGLILFAHGARDPRWADPFMAMARRIRHLEPQVEVSPAYLEFMQPSLPEAGQNMVESGCVRVDIVPVFLGAGGHVRRDLPQLVRELQDRHAGVAWVLHEALGEWPSVIQALSDAALEALKVRP